MTIPDEPTIPAPLHHGYRAGSALRLFWKGFGYPFRAARFLWRHPRLLILMVIPAVINMILLALVLVSAILWAPDLTSLVWDRPELHSIWGGMLLVMWAIVTILLGFFLLTLGFVVIYALAGILATPFTGYLSEKVEGIHLGPPAGEFQWKVFLGDIWLSVSHSLLNLILYLALLLPLLLLNLLPVVGNVLFVAGSGILTVFFLARDMLDGPLSRRRLGFRAKFRYIWRHRALMAGLGAASALLLWIPLLNFLCLPVAMTGGTLLFCHLEQDSDGWPSGKGTTAPGKAPAD
ncbi:MAG: EI24 domain-containing protein [Acidobacteria bacterium]|nr:EI24 domain-containing protein [Acidobacteriota bacterium]